MKSLVKAKAEVGLWLEDIAIPVIGHNDVLVKIKKTAICGTDIHIFNWDEWAQKTIPIPMTVGHEFAGKIVEIGTHKELIRKENGYYKNLYEVQFLKKRS